MRSERLCLASSLHGYHLDLQVPTPLLEVIMGTSPLAMHQVHSQAALRAEFSLSC